MIERLHAGQAIVAALLVVAFTAPGARAVARWDADGRISWPARVALGFVASFGVFSAATGPLLLAHAPLRWAVVACCALWLLGVLGVLLWPRAHTPGAPADHDSDAVDLRPELTAPAPRASVAAGLLCLASLLCAIAFAANRVPRRAALAAAVLLFAANLWLLARSALGATARERAVGHEPADGRLRPLLRAAAVAAAGLLAFATVATTIGVREDADDLLYLSEALTLRDAPAMAVENPAHRGEGLPANVLYAWQAFELWGALVARASDVHPVILFRTLLAPFVLLLAAGLCLELWRRVLPRDWIGVGMLLTLAYLTFGISSHWTANNYLMPRPAQGKTWLVHVAVPALVLLGYEFMRRPRRGSWCLLLLACSAGLGFAPMAVFLVPAALGALLLAFLALWPSRAHLVRAAAAGCALLPVAWFGLYVATHVHAQLSEEIADRVAPSLWRDDFLFGHLNFANGGGALEVFVLIALPLAALPLRRRAQLFFPVAFTLLLFATALNPLLHPLVGGKLTGWEGYIRLFWLVPYPFLLGLLAASLLRAAAAAPRPALAGAALLAAFLAALPLAGASFVFGPGNPSGGTSPAPYLARNAYKMPGDLLALAALLAQLPLGPQARILCSERTASHLAPLVPGFDFVYTRDYQTRAALRSAGRFDEAREREWLARPFLAGGAAPEEAVPLLERHAAVYVIQEQDAPRLVEALEQAGFALRASFGAYRLWARAPSAAAAPAAAG